MKRFSSSAPGSSSVETGGARRAVELTKKKEHPKIGVIATEATVSSCAYADAIRRASDRAEVFQKACPLFVALAEENWTNEPETRSIAGKYLEKIVAAKDEKQSAIGSRRAAEIYGGKILRENIADDLENITWFYLLGRK